MFEKYYATGYTLYEPFENQWVIECHGGSKYYGNVQEIFDFMNSRLLFSFAEIERGFEAMLTAGHNAAHFGINRTLIYTFTKEISDDCKAG